MLGSLNREQVLDILSSNSVGRIGCSDGKRVYVVPITYAFDGENVIGHTTPGLKLDYMRINPDVCFEVDEMRSLSEWQSVIAWGKFIEITDEAEKREAMQFFIKSVLHLEISETAKLKELPSKSITPHEPGNQETIVFKIRLVEMNGRYETKRS